MSKSRLVQEVRCLNRAAKLGVKTPVIWLVQMEQLRIFMEFVQGLSLKEFMYSQKVEQVLPLCVQLGTIISRLHLGDITHGDLTTSNVLVDSNNTLVMIDFGLARPNATDEDKAVDLYVLERAFSSTHPGSEKLYQAVLDAYTSHGEDNSKDVITKLEKVRRRGRKRTAVG